MEQESPIGKPFLKYKCIGAIVDSRKGLISVVSTTGSSAGMKN